MKSLVVATLIFFASQTHAARIIEFQDDLLKLRSDLPSSNFTSLVFPKVREAITICDSGDWKDWQTPSDALNFCEMLVIADATKTETGKWTVWNLNGLAQCKYHQDQADTLEAKLSFK